MFRRVANFKSAVFDEKLLELSTDVQLYIQSNRLLPRSQRSGFKHEKIRVSHFATLLQYSLGTLRARSAHTGAHLGYTSWSVAEHGRCGGAQVVKGFEVMFFGVVTCAYALPVGISVPFTVEHA